MSEEEKAQPEKKEREAPVREAKPQKTFKLASLLELLKKDNAEIARVTFADLLTQVNSPSTTTVSLKDLAAGGGIPDFPTWLPASEDLIQRSQELRTEIQRLRQKLNEQPKP